MKKANFSLHLIRQYKLTLVLVYILSGCGSLKDYRAANKTSWLKRNGYLVEKSDTVWKIKITPADTIQISIPIGIDQHYLDSALDAQKDSCIGKETIKKIFVNVPCKIEPAHYEDSTCKIDAFIKNGKLEIVKIDKEQKDSIPIITHTKIVKLPEKYIPWWVWLIIIAEGVVILGLSLRGRN